MVFERIVKFGMPFDKRHKDPKKNYGIGALKIWFILKKGQKAVQVLISTNSYLNSIITEYNKKGLDLFNNKNTFDCYDVGYHSDKPMFEGHTKMKCDLLKGGFCYYDGSSLRGMDDKVAENFIEHGEDWIWTYLEKHFDAVFNNKDNGC